MNKKTASAEKKSIQQKRKKLFKHGRLIKLFVSITVFVTIFTIGLSVMAADSSISLTLNGVETPSGTANTLQIIFLLTILSLAPSILIMMTSFTRIIIVLSLLRNALGLQQSPPNQVLVGIALFLTLFIMMPVGQQINKEAYQPYINNEITFEQAKTNAIKPLRTFMLKNTENTSMKAFLKMAKIEKVETNDDIPTYVLIPAFIMSELKKAFMMGFIIYLPFLVIDIIVSSTLMSMGMMMLPPTMLSLPLKLALFVMVDGWSLTVESLIRSFK
ncbi:MAG: flagellar type III secretion system pore protein FliP [[Clostridium] cellulosi]|nr:MAG: flagellar biosynthetic protein FliP [[Clostridium] cellulosi]